MKRRHDPRAVAPRIAVEDELEVRRRDQESPLVEEPDARQVSGGGTFGGEGIARDHRLVRTRRVGTPPGRIEGARHAVLGAGRHRVVEVAGEHAIELENGFLVPPLAAGDFADEELAAGGDIRPRVPIDDAAQESDRLLGIARQIDRCRMAELGLGLDPRVPRELGNPRELLGGAPIVLALEEDVGLGEQRRVPERRRLMALGDFLIERRRLELAPSAS